MLKLFTGTDLHLLARTLLDEFREYPQHNLLAPELFVVQNYGMARWLSLFIAEKEDVAANLQFKFPAEVYWQVMRIMDSEIPKSLPSDRIPMTWMIFELLKTSDIPAFSMLYQYVQHNGSTRDEMRCWNLAYRIADVFDQYLTYRPEMLRKWEDSEFVADDSTNKWQPILWQKLCEHWKKMGKNESRHRADLEQELRKKINNISIDDLPPRITVFGVSEMPEAYIQMLVKLSKRTDVHFYIVDVSSSRANPLIGSLGQVGMEFKSLLYKQAKQERGNISVEENEIKLREVSPLNFFENVKHELITGSGPASEVVLDDSVQIYSCHSPRREVEVLYDYLLQMLDEHKALEPSDIMVLCPNMDEYGPEIEAVFGVVEKGLPEIPYHMAESTAQPGNVNLTFRKLLQILDSRFKVTEVLDLLDSWPIRQAFSFTDDDVNLLEKWIGDTNVHWGIDSIQKQSLGLPDTDSFTWQSGLNRMMAGYAMQPEEDTLFQQIYPYDEIQQTSHARLLGRFAWFLNQLFTCYYQIKTKKSLSVWSDVFRNWLSVFIADEEAYFRELQNIQKIVHSLAENEQLTKINAEVSFSVVRSYIENQLDQTSTGGGRPGPGITFSGIVSMRNIPAKVICMIGINDGVFPRSKTGVEFNLITKNPKAGDRLPGKEDRQIFLENVLAAQNRIYFSYTGQSNKKEAEFPPSVILREFIDYLSEKYKIDDSSLVQSHKLQSFSSSYFIKNRANSLFSYSEKSKNIASRLKRNTLAKPAFLLSDLPKPDDSFRKLSISEFVSFFRNPAKFLLQQRFGIYLYEDEVLDEDREMFALDNLTKYQIGQELLDRYLVDKQPLQKFRDVAFAKSVLPEGWPGKTAFDIQAHKVREFGTEIKQQLNQKKLDPVEVDVKIGEFQISGQLDQIYEQCQLFFRYGNMRAKDLIELWIKHLLFQMVKLEEHAGDSRLFTRHKKYGIAHFQFASMSNHTEILRDLLKMYWSGLQRNIHFYPNSSFAFAEKVIYKNKDVEEGFKAADREWIDQYGGYPKEGDDPYIKRLYGNYNTLNSKDLRDKFEQFSRLFWAPFFAELNETGAGLR